MNEASSRLEAILELRSSGDATHPDVIEHLKALRNCCACGAEYQQLVIDHPQFSDYLKYILFGQNFDHDSEEDKEQFTAWQLLANSIVGNRYTQQVVWDRFGQALQQHCINQPLDRCTKIKLMILYNIYIGETGLLNPQDALVFIVKVWQKVHDEKYDQPLDFLHLFFEKFLVEDGRTTVRCYAHLQTAERTTFLDYMHTYLVEDTPARVVHTFLLQYICKEFKMKSDCVLRHTSQPEEEQKVNELHPRETVALIRVIACASGFEKYAHVFATDHSLFLNVSGLLRCLVAAGKETSEQSIYTPLTKLEEVALSSNTPHDFESDVSFELKTLLVRSIANLLYKNAKNKEYCLDTEVMPALFECTNMDARNPLIKEWSILAIRNACDECPDIQQIVADLSSQGPAQNDILNELNLDLGSLRIQPKE